MGRGKQNFDGAGPCTGYLGTVTDVTARRAAHESLREVEQRYEAMAANVPGMVYRLAVSPDGERSMLYASDGCRDIYGCEPEEMVADASLATRGVHPRDAEEQARSILESAAQLAPWDRHWRELRADGSVSWLHGVSRPHRAADGSTVWDGIVLDETNVREAQERLQLVIDNLAGSAVVLYDRELRLQFCEGPLFASSDVASMLGRPLPDFVHGRGLRGSSRGASPARSPASRRPRCSRECRTVRWPSPSLPIASRTAGSRALWCTGRTSASSGWREAARDRAEESFQLAFERAPIGMAIIGADGASSGQRRALRELGHSAHELIGKSAHTTRTRTTRRASAASRRREQRRGDEMQLRRCMRAGTTSVSAKAAVIRTTPASPPRPRQVQDITGGASRASSSTSPTTTR